MENNTPVVEPVQVLNSASVESSNQQVSSPPVYTDLKAELAQVKGLLSEARQTREVLVNFEAAVKSGTYIGQKMMDLAKGLAFLDAILRQNSAHVSNLQERVDKLHGND